MGQTQARFVSEQALLEAFYEPVFDLARLAQTCEVSRSLDARRDVAEGRDTWRLRCELPMLLEKMWADLQQLRYVPDKRRRRRAAPAALLEGCIHLYTGMRTAVMPVVSEELSQLYMQRAVDLHLRTPWTPVLSSDSVKAGRIMQLLGAGQAREALAMYFSCRVSEHSGAELRALGVV
jgi:hypothetical protein